MPARSSSSSVVTWPDSETVAQAVAAWARRAVQERPGIERIGYFGSYARGDWGVGSDLDLVVVAPSEEPFERRAASWDVLDLPVPADVLVYTPEEWDSVRARGRFGTVLARETVWVYVAQPRESPEGGEQEDAACAPQDVNAARRGRP